MRTPSRRSCRGDRWRRSAPRPPTSWCGGRRGTTPRRTEALREVVAAFEQETGKQVELVLYPWRSFRIRSRRRSKRARRPTSPSVSGPRPHRRMGLRRSAGRSLGRHRPLFGPVRSGSAGPGHAAQRNDGPESYCTACRWVKSPTSPTSGRASWSRPVSPSRTSPESGKRTGPSGATGAARRAPGHRPRRPLGRGASDVGRSG